MRNTLWNRRYWSRALAGLAAPGLLALAAGGVPAGQPVPAEQPAPVAQPSPTVLAHTLAEYRALALERQPALAAYRASLSAAQAKVEALQRLALAGLIRRDLPTRRKQAELGVAAAQAQLRKAEGDTLYAVTRTYFSALYARQQLAVADRALDENDVLSLPYLRKIANEIYQGGTRRDVRKWDVDQIDVLTFTTRARREEAAQGVHRARAALREAIGLDFGCTPTVAGAAELPFIDVKPELGAIVYLARQRRGEMVQAAVGAETTALEIEAQKAIFGPSGDTFASGADLHAQPVPQGIANSEYRPGAVSIEMPDTLIGHRSLRVEQAKALAARAAAVVDKTRQLITLEAEDSYLKWREAYRQAEELEKAAKAAAKVADEVRDAFQAVAPQPTRPTLNELLAARLRSTELRLQANEARFRLLLALATLERVTAGGFCPDYTKAAQPGKDDKKPETNTKPAPTNKP